MRISKRLAGGIIGSAALCGLVAGGSVIAFAESGPVTPAEPSATPASAMPTTASWPVNEYGLTVGIPNEADRLAQNLPDLTPGQTDSGDQGFIRAGELYLPDPTTPEEAARQTASQINAEGEWIETVYEADGRTPVGQILVTVVTENESLD